MKKNKHSVIINIFNTVPLPVSKKYIRAVVKKILLHSNCSDNEVSFLFCGNAEIKKYNRKYLQTNRCTDVIAFYDDSKLPGYQKKYLGDIIVSAEQAKIQAKQLKHSNKKELITLIIHGILHLLGYKDTSKSLKKKMFNRQEKILKKIS
ncbi:MAG: rRNA maturation RNase YbeY [bacterium]